MRDDDGKKNPDSDRAAILARRKQFIALALSGLATTACTDGDKADDDKSKTEVKPAGGPEVPPHPCLEIAAPPEPQPNVPPHACLKVAPPDPYDEAAETGEADKPGETGEVEQPPPPPEPKPEAKPRPCLRKAAPKPCLKVAE